MFHMTRVSVLIGTILGDGTFFALHEAREVVVSGGKEAKTIFF